MAKRISMISGVIAAVAAAGVFLHGGAQSTEVPDYSGKVPAAAGEQIAVLAGGCFWGVDAVFKHVKGVSKVVSGYSGGDKATANYAVVSNGGSGHAEAVQITYDPAKISYAQLLKVFFSVAHDPTEVNRQGPDVGTQYRSAIFYTSEEQKQVAQTYVEQLNKAKVFRAPIASQIVPLKEFFPAEAYHQNYLALHPNESYIMYHDMPKLENLKKMFASIYQ
ncbi:peptide-methionine (S)-S-oxide reductase MsrA [soil metagenome]